MAIRLIQLLPMAKIQNAVVLSVILAVCIAQTVNLSQIYTPQTLSTLGPEYNDPSFVKLINNYFGCKNWTDGGCAECSSGYIFNKQGVCCLVDSQCQQFNSDVGICELCYTGYSVSSNGSCQATPSDSKNNGCAEWKSQTCSKCSVRYFFNSDNICVPVSDNCREWSSNGECTSCYYGFGVVNGSCLLEEQPNIHDVKANPLCAKWKLGCLACAERSLFNANGICQAVNDYCNTWDKLTGQCLSCYNGYDLTNGTCHFSSSNNAAPKDAGCSKWSNGICQQCSSSWVFNANGLCIPVSDQCKTHDASGNCLTCYVGYDLVNGSCLFSEHNNAKPTDAGCKSWDWANLKCSACSNSWVFDANGLCIPVSDHCRTSDSAGLCSGCYRGYDLVNDSCVFSPSNSAPLSDAGCKIWNWTTNSCAECSLRWVLAKSNVCAQVSQLCNTYSDVTGECSSCYNGYDLANGTCVFSSSNTAAPKDAGCSKWANGVCQQCSSSWVFNANGICIPVSDQCKTHDASGNCLTCYVGYDLVNGSCLYSSSNNAKPTDGGCRTWDWINAKCTACSNNWVFNSNGLCIPVSDQCRTSSSQGLCTSCYKGYDLTNGTCLFSSSNSAPLADAGCRIWNWTTNSCSECSDSWYLWNEVCSEVSTLCKSYDSATGHCLSCFIGYDLVNGSCVYSSSNSAAPADAGCRSWAYGVCQECSNYFSFNSKGVCTPVSDQCKTYSGLSCTSCFNGYILNNGSCILSELNSAHPSDAGCGLWDWAKQVCVKCSQNWFSSNGICLPVSDLCKAFDSANGWCLSCFKGYDLVNGSCIASSANSKPSDPGCSDWSWEKQTCLSCSPYWVLINGSCVAVSPYCKSYAPSGECTSCFTGYSLSNGACSSVSTLCKTQNADGSCSTCYKGYALYLGKCVSLSSIADIALYYASCCPQKLAKLQAQGRIPK